ncbi:uncharacterized protein [Nicotiana tomentosiformis]|uniref:uncharacterized protein isoform X1 n=1 Tax=Nicotiana tomentosiformis TaxID=4098 RepID=UPI00051AE0A9|nr:calcyclin-binding protein isoform X1 [Nicotiana tomentosiformis]
MAANDLALDLEELKHLQSIAKRPRIVSLISSEIRNLEKLSKDGASVPSSQMPAPVSSAAKVTPSQLLNYVSVASFSWDQDNDKVKIYLSLEGVDQEKMETEFKQMSFDAKFHDVHGKNYRFSLPKLNKEIVPEKCKVLVKPTRVVITLTKASKGNWLDLHYKEDKVNTVPWIHNLLFDYGACIITHVVLVTLQFKPNLDKEKDPMAGIMDLMKNMYEDGDEEMKRTIAKAWTDARSGKAADPLKRLS